MLNGKYYENWNPGAYMGTMWEGNFIIELADKSVNVISRTDLNNIYKELLIFNSSFQVQFDDYNNDGDIDFTIGQYVSSNGRDYKLFTLRKDGTVLLCCVLMVLVYCGLRIYVEKSVYEQLSPEHQNDFLLTYTTTDKPTLAKE